MTHFIIARPQPKATQTAELFRQQGIKAIELPVIKIIIMPIEEFKRDLSTCKKIDDLVMTSTYAVDWLFEYKGYKLIDFSHIQNVVCVGQSTAKKFKQGLQNILNEDAFKGQIHVPFPANSEGIVNLPIMTLVKNRNIVVLKGKDGRGLIETELLKRGATVSLLDVYQRIVDTQAIKMSNIELASNDCIVATSVEIVQSLFNHYDKQSLQAIKWIVPSKRIKDYTNKLGAKQVLLSKSAHEQALACVALQLVNTGVVDD